MNVIGDGPERATLGYESGSLPLTVWTADGKARQPKLKGGGEATAAFTLELQAAVNGVKAHREPAWLSGRLARDALVMCHQECRSVRTGRPVTIA